MLAYVPIWLLVLLELADSASAESYTSTRFSNVLAVSDQKFSLTDALHADTNSLLAFQIMEANLPL